MHVCEKVNLNRLCAGKTATQTAHEAFLSLIVVFLEYTGQPRLYFPRLADITLFVFSYLLLLPLSLIGNFFSFEMRNEIFASRCSCRLNKDVKIMDEEIEEGRR